MTLNELEERIMHRIYRCNELNETQAVNYAAIAMDEVKRFSIELIDAIAGSLSVQKVPNQHMNGFNANREARSALENDKE